MTERHGKRPDKPECEPSPAITSKARTATWALRNNTNENAAVRELDEPAPTLFFGARCNDVSWVLRNRRDSDAWVDSDGERPNRTVAEPAPTLTAEAHRWPWERPATTVVGSYCPDVIASPGYRTSTSRQNAEASVRVTVAEASVLQSFRPDYPWQGSRTKQFEQIGNAVPPRLAAHALSAVTGIPLSPPLEVPA